MRRFFRFIIRMDSESDVAEQANVKLPLRRLEPALNQCVRVVIPLHIDLLGKHKRNIEKFSELHEWDKMHREQINASRTVQQLKADIWAVDVIRNQVQENDMKVFQKTVDPVRDLAKKAIAQFDDLQGAIFRKKDFLQSFECDTQNDVDFTPSGDLSKDLEEEFKVREKYENAKAAAASWKLLQRDLMDLGDTVSTFATIVHEQQEPLQRIEDNIETTVENVKQGTNYLAQAAKLKAVMFPVVGAVIGGCIGGPVGLLVGIKAGGAAAVVGGVLGYQSGRFVKEKTKAKIDTEMVDINEQGAASTQPDLIDFNTECTSSVPTVPSINQ